MSELPLADDQQQYLTFVLGGEPFAIGILSVKEIIEYIKVTPVPLVPPFVRGVMNLRGSVVPVIDLSARFGRAPSVLTRRSGVVVVEVECDGAKQCIGLLVDAVSTVQDIPAAEIEPPPPFGADIRSDFIKGIARVQERFVVILDLGRVLCIDEMARLLAAQPTPYSGLEAAAASG